ncbi:protein S100-A1-like [Centroberyx affinis]|uniref:protein S100-A1-like n=1 Tax=Centroberyx affinis TaxID=166261 RepID=UPI003A5BA7C1
MSKERKKERRLSRRVCQPLYKKFPLTVRCPVPLFLLLSLLNSSHNFVTMTDVQTAMTLLIKAFHKYSSKEGDNATLTKGELNDLLKAELKDMLPKGDPARVDKVFKDLDADQSGTVDFNEYIVLVAALTTICNEFLGSPK